MNNILLVDDEANILASLKREFLSSDGDYAVETFTSPLEALACAKSKAFDLVISDYRMPDMDGVAFLNAFREIQPDAARLILSGLADREALVQAINSAHIFRFITKPWKELEMIGAVTQALAYHRIVSENRRLAEVYRAKFGEPMHALEAGKHYQVLVVGDDPNVLNTLSHDLSQHSRFEGLYAAMRRETNPQAHPDSHDFRFIVETATSPRDALEQAKRVGYDLVIADYRMPDMDGVSFLEAFREIQPDAARILFSGQADMKTLIDAINRSEIYAFIGTPWHEYDLRNTVTQAIVFRNLMQENRRLGEILGGAQAT